MATSEAPNPDRSTWGRRCSLGCESWPDSLDYRICLRCGGETTRFSNLQPMNEDDARSQLLEARFHEHYEKHCAKLRIPPTGPLPEWYEQSLEPLPKRLLKPSHR